jgi:pimeloyl-ACP methyl ester carboxylesterase
MEASSAAQGGTVRPSGERAPPAELPDTLIFHPMPAGSETAIVSFSANGGGRKHFHFFRLLEPVPEISKLLVRDPNDSWYNAGLPGVGDTIEEIADRIELEVAELGAKRTIAIGSSMGAYAAILFGCLIGAERVVALAPQTYLDPILPHAPPAGVELQAPDLRPVLQEATGTKVEIVAGWDALIDVFHAQRVAELAPVRVLALKNHVHSFMSALHTEGKLLPLVLELIEGGTPEICQVEPRLAPGIEERIAATVFAEQRGEWQRVAREISPVAERYPDWAGPNFTLGQALSKLGDWTGAEAVQARAVRANPGWTKPRGFLVRAMRKRGGLVEAEQVLRDGIGLDADWGYGHLTLARCLLEQGRKDEAGLAARRAAELEPRYAEAAEELTG